MRKWLRTGVVVSAAWAIGISTAWSNASVDWGFSASLQSLAATHQIKLVNGKVHPNSLDVFAAHVYGSIQQPQCTVGVNIEQLDASARYVQLRELGIRAQIPPNVVYDLLTVHEMGHCVLAKSAFASESAVLIDLWKDPWVQEAFSDVYALLQVRKIHGTPLYEKMRAFHIQRRQKETVPYYQTHSAMLALVPDNSTSEQSMCVQAWHSVMSVKGIRLSDSMNKLLMKGCLVK